MRTLAGRGLRPPPGRMRVVGERRFVTVEMRGFAAAISAVRPGRRSLHVESRNRCAGCYQAVARPARTLALWALFAAW
jgi:hypothetical protein